MLPPEQVAQDETIFRPDGFIKIPRSDGDPTYGPPNTVVPPKTDREVNYYHIFKREERRHDTWRAALGEQLAQYFKLDSLSRSKTKWKLYDFPEHYYFTEQRKGPALDPRTDPYLFGSQGHRFRSTKEAVDHLAWLLMDPELNPANCRCRYCHKVPRTSTGGGDGVTPKKAAAGTKRKAEPLAASTAAMGGRRGRKSQNADGNEVQSATAITVRSVEMRRLVPGVTIASVPQRDQEVMPELKRGEKERFRVGEVVWCELDEPVVDPTDPMRKITAWPVVVLDPAIEFTSMLGYYHQDDDDQKTSLEAVSAPQQRSESPPTLGGSSVHQTQAYQVTFFGTMEKAKVPESALTPYLAGLIPNELIESDLGTHEDHPWLFNENQYPNLNLTRQPNLPAPDFTQSIVAFGFAVEAVAVLRNLYNLTDAYSVSDTPEGALRDLGVTPGDGDGQTSQGMRYYQGMYFGLERLWVGDVVRLKLGKTHLQQLQRQLNKTLVDDKQPGAPDPAAIILDEDGSYVLQLAAIYEDPRAPKTVHVAGEIYQIMSQSKYNAMKADNETMVKKLEADESLDAAAKQEETKQLEARLPQPCILRGKPGFPPMPPLPQGFVMISLGDRLQTRIPRETNLVLGHIAGRIYPSLGMHLDGPRVADQIKQRPADRKLAADEDTQVDLRARLSVAGLLSGCVKAMRGSVHTWTRTASFKGALALAREKVRKLITGEFEDSDMEEEDALPAAAAAGALSPTKTPAKKAKNAASETRKQNTIGSNGGQSQQQQTAAGTQTTTTTISASSAPAPAPAPALAAEVSEIPPSSEDEPPLAPGWVPRKSRNLGSWYYVHTETKKTQWERPIL